MMQTLPNAPVAPQSPSQDSSSSSCQRLIPRQPFLVVKSWHTLHFLRRTLPLNVHRRSALHIPIGLILPCYPLTRIFLHSLGPPAFLIGILEIHARHDRDLPISGPPHVFAEQLRLPLEALALAEAAEVDGSVEDGLCGEGHSSIPAGEDLERPLEGEPRLGLGIEGKEVL